MRRIRGRNLNHLISVGVVNLVDDGFGGKTNAFSSLGDFWANLRTRSAGQNDTIAGISLSDQLIDVEVRPDFGFRLDEKIHFVQYNGDTFKIVSRPENVNLNDSMIRFLIKLIDIRTQ